MLLVARVTGHLRISGKPRRYFASYTDREGTRHTKLLGPAWVRDSGRKTPRGATIWHAAAGPCPPGHLTPRAAEDALAKILEAERAAPRTTPGPGMAFAAVAEAYVTYLRVEKQRKPSTIQDARNVIRATLVPHYGADTRVETITTADVDALRIKLLVAGRAPRTVQKTMVIGRGIFSLARRRGWIPENPATTSEKIQLRDDDAFNILSPEQFELVCAAAVRADGTMAGLQLSLAFYLGMRQGEIMDLPWGAVDFGRKLVHVGSSFTHG
jgi:hypothetical protein